MDKSNKTAKRLTTSVVMVIILSLCLCITTFALVYSTVSVDNNLFQTGVVKINLNDGKPVIESGEFLFEPGMTVEKSFFLENQSTWDVYYKLYFHNVEGSLADVIEVSILDEKSGAELFSGLMTELTRESVGAADDVLLQNERRNLKIIFHFPESAGNETQELYVSFDMSADAVQTKNNPDRLFQ